MVYNIETFDTNDIEKIKDFRNKLIDTDESNISRDFLLKNIEKVINILNETTTKSIDDNSELVRQLLRLLTNLTCKAVSVINELIETTNYYMVMKKILVYFTKECDSTLKYRKQNIISIFDSLLNLTCQFEIVAVENMKQGFIQIALDLLERTKLVCERNLNDDESIELCTSLSGFLMRNSEFTIIKDDLIGLNIIKKLEKRNGEIHDSMKLGEHNDMLKKLKIDSITILSRLLDDKELDDLVVSEDVVRIFLKTLEETITNADINQTKFATNYYIKYDMLNSYSYLFASDIMVRLFKITVNDRIKQKIYDLNGLNPILTLFINGNSDEEYWSCQLLCSLCFNENVVKALNINNEFRNALNRKAVNPLDPDSKSFCKQIIEMINNTFQTRLSSVRAQKPKSYDQQHVMISYNHKSQEQCLKLNEALKKRGYKTWMDVENTFSNLLDGMSAAVENASVILICYTEDYKESVNCRLEAEYAYDCRKPIIPIKMTNRFKPNGWLGLILSGKLYIDLSKETKDEKEYENLCKQINLIINGDEIRSVIPQSKILCKKEELRKWKPIDVINWLNLNNLNEFNKVFSEYNGLTLLQLYEMKQKDYKRFCDIIESEISENQTKIVNRKKLLLYQAFDDLV